MTDDPRTERPLSERWRDVPAGELGPAIAVLEVRLTAAERDRRFADRVATLEARLAAAMELVERAHGLFDMAQQVESGAAVDVLLDAVERWESDREALRNLPTLDQPDGAEAE